MVELCAKILQIMHAALEDYVPSFCQLCTNYRHHFFRFVLLIFSIL